MPREAEAYVHRGQQEREVLAEGVTNAASSSAVLTRIRPKAMSASRAGSRSPAINAAIIARPETPKMSLATTDSFTPASSSSFSTRCFSAVRTATRSVRYRIRSRPPYRRWQHETRSQHLTFGDLAHPDRVDPVGLRPPRQVLDVARVDQSRLRGCDLAVRQGLDHR